MLSLLTLCCIALLRITSTGHGHEWLTLPVLTRYLSEATLTKIRSSPMRTFSPSDLCLDAGWIVHQQASPAEAEITTKRIRRDSNASA